MGPSNGRRATAALADAIFSAFPQVVPGLDREPVSGLGIDSSLLSREQLDQALTPDRLDPFAQALQRVGNCAQPIRLRGHSTRVDASTGEILSSYSSAEEITGLTYLRCGNRRENVCPSCARLYAADTFQLIRAGIVGGKTVPEHVADNPLVFATLTAPSFGLVHGRSSSTGICHRRAKGPAICQHGRPRTCPVRHAEDDPLLGQPLCPSCYDYASHAVWHWFAPDLWRRFTIALRRSLAKQLGVPATALPEVATVQYAKVAEPQHRAAIHFHALIRLDGSRTKEGFEPASQSVDASLLAQLVLRAAASVRLEVPGVDDDDPMRVLTFGRQADARPVTTKRRPDDPTRQLAPEQVAGYLAKYATKSATGDAPAENHHHRRLRATCRELASRERAAVAAQRAGQASDEAHQQGVDAHRRYRHLGRWVHAYGFRGHFCTKSRRYSITRSQLCRARRRFSTLLAEHQRTGALLDLAAVEADLLADDDTETTLVIGQWTYVGSGWANQTERTLALAAAARAREYDQWRAEQRRKPKTPGEGNQ